MIPGKLVLEPTTDPTGFELGKVTVFVNLHLQDPAPGQEINILTKLATVGEPDSIIVQVTLETLPA